MADQLMTSTSMLVAVVTADLVEAVLAELEQKEQGDKRTGGDRTHDKRMGRHSSAADVPDVLEDGLDVNVDGVEVNEYEQSADQHREDEHHCHQ